MVDHWRETAQKTMTHTPANDVSAVYIAPGMPPLKESNRSVSFFEFWPTWLVYLPVVFYSFFLAIKHRSLTLPLIANPYVHLSGMVGFSKADLLAQGNNYSQQYILPWITHCRSDAELDDQVTSIQQRMQEQELTFPIVGKPDMGCRGAGVKLLADQQALRNCLSSYPIGATIMLQKLAEWEPEAGIFYVRHPGELEGEIVSLSFKYSPYVIGDGQSTLSELLDKDKRAKKLRRLYDKRHKLRLNEVIPAGEKLRLVFSASHSKGAIFTDGNDYLTPQLTKAVDKIMQGIPQFYYGRLDVKFKDIDSLQRGENMAIVEINGASSESLHIWDRNARFLASVKALLFQYRTLFTIGALNRRQGLASASLSELFAAWKQERQYTVQYPDTD